MKKIKPLSKRHRFRRWLRRVFGFKPPEKDFRHLLADLDEMHTVDAHYPLYFVCPCCGAKSPFFGTAKRDPRQDGYTIDHTIIDEQPLAESKKDE